MGNDCGLHWVIACVICAESRPLANQDSLGLCTRSSEFAKRGNAAGRLDTPHVVRSHEDGDAGMLPEQEGKLTPNRLTMDSLFF